MKKAKNKTETFSFEDKYAEIYSMPKFFHAGREISKSKFIFSEHHHVNYEWIYITKGSVKYWINDVCMQANAGDFYYVQPGQSHREESITEFLEFYFIRFYYLDLQGQVHYFVTPPGNPETQLIRDSNKEFEKMFIKIYKEAKENKPGSKQIIESLILHMIWLLQRNLKLDYEIPTDKVSYRVQLVNTAIKYLQDNVSRNISLSELASVCCISQDYLSHIFKNITGISPIQYTLRLKIDEAKSLLQNTDYSVAYISNSLGFEDPLYFSRAFKKIVSLSPSKYRLLNNQ